MTKITLSVSCHIYHVAIEDKAGQGRTGRRKRQNKEEEEERLYDTHVEVAVGKRKHRHEHKGTPVLHTPGHQNGPMSGRNRRDPPQEAVTG